MKPGTAMPTFSLPGIDGKMYSPADYKESKIIAILFLCNHCPYVHKYASRIKTLIETFSPPEVVFIGINPNDDHRYPADSFDNMPPMAEKTGLGNLYLRDESQLVARLFGAERTPEVFLFDKNRMLVYKGGIDDNCDHPADVEAHYLYQAISQTLHQKPVTSAETPAVGCTVKWKL